MDNQKVMTLTIQDVTYEGKGVAKANDKIIFVENALYDEIVEARIYGENSKYLKAKTVKILKKSQYRVDPVCKYFGRCGGCNLRHMVYDRQLKLKKDIVMSNIRRMAHLDLFDLEILGSPVPDNYRNKAQYKVRDYKMGFYEEESHIVSFHDECLLLDKTINQIKKVIEPHLTPDIIEVTIKKADDGCMVVLETSNYNFQNSQLLDALKKTGLVISAIQKNGNNKNLLFGKPYITDHLMGKKFNISADSFYQVNKVQTEKLYNKATEFLTKNISEEDLKTKKVLDLYCGIGTIGLILADKVDKVIGVDIVTDAIRNAKDNAKINKISNAEFICKDAKDAIGDINYDILVIDPPRKGMDKEVLTSIKQHMPETILYVSCNSATLARDLYELKNQYEIQDICAVDMFSHTSHVEAVVLMSRQK